MKTIVFFLILFISYTYSPLSANELVIRHVAPEGKVDLRSTYFIDLLNLTLEKTFKKEGKFRLETSDSKMTQARAILSVSQNQYLDIVWTMTSKNREEILRPIRIPLLKGLLGHRVFIIRKQDKTKFENIHSSHQLKPLFAGQGHDWPDSKILKANGFNVMNVPNYDGLFGMLSLGRFDYFPRGVNEAWSEVNSHPEKELMVEKTILLKYPAPIYFFVHKQNTSLAGRIERGLHLAIEDGSFDRLFHEHPNNKPLFKRLNIQNRKVFHLNNPFIPDETPLDRPELWYLLQNKVNLHENN